MPNTYGNTFVLQRTGRGCLLPLLLALSAGLFAQIPNASAFIWHDRWDNYVDRTYGWRKISSVAVETAFDQTFQLRRCGRAPYCFPEDFGASMAGRTARNTIELGAGALFHEDLRRRPSGLPGFRQRVAFALLHAPLAKNAEGNWEPAYARYAGTFAGVTVSSAWHGRPLTTGKIFEGAGWTMTSYFQDALLTEFEPDMRRAAGRFGTKLRGGAKVLFLQSPLK